jgi:hypothetical protein
MPVANAESRRERAFRRAGKSTVANSAPTRKQRAVLGIVVAVMRSVEEDDGIKISWVSDIHTYGSSGSAFRG